MKIIAVVSAKGGVGKTTVSANLSMALAQLGPTVLGVDLDPQNALCLHFGLSPQEIRGSSRATLMDEDWSGSLFKTESGVYMLPYGLITEKDRVGFEQRLEADPDWLISNLGRLALGPNDIVVIDTPPGPSTYMRQALRVAHVVVIVTLPDAASYATLALMQRLVQTYCEPNPAFLGHLYLVNQVDQSRQLAKDVTQVIRENFGDRLLGTIHQDQAVCEALAFDKTVLQYDPLCQATQDFLACSQTIATLLR